MIAKGCLKFILLPLCAVLLISISMVFVTTYGQLLLVIIFASIGLFCAVFFRDPNRAIGEGIVSPADGRILKINTVGSAIRIAIFMNIFDVHVNRSPLSGRIVSVRKIKGKFLPAYLDGSENNNRVEILLETAIGNVKVVQLSGIFARRIVSYVKKGEVLSKGQRIGIVMFGSRVDMYLPAKKVEVLVRNGMRVYAGKTTIARFVKCLGG